jgi:uncharacterized protein YbjQ (UPF0145 family)
MTGAGGAPFSSALGAREAFAVREAGMVPLKQVLGVSYYKFGWQQMWTGRRHGGPETFELESQTAAWNDARRLAVDRLRDEARAVGADAVVGVRIQRRHRDWDVDLVEFMATGTAVRTTAVRVDLREAPLLCTLSGQDVAKLIAHGFWPVGIVGGSTVAYAQCTYAQAQRTSGLFSGMRNQELSDFSHGMYEARALAMGRLERAAHELHAHGVVGLQLDRSQREREVDGGAGTRYADLIITLHVLGTAIIEAQQQPDAPPPKYITLPLNR